MSNFLMRGIVVFCLVLAWQLSARSESLQTEAKKPVDGNSPKKTDVYGDPLPHGAVARLGTLRWRHDGFVHHLVFSPDDKTLAAGGSETILYGTTTGKEIRRLQVSPHGKWGNALWFSPDGKTLVVAGNKEVSFWDVASGKQVRSQPFDAHAHWKLSVCLSPNGKLMARACEGDQALLIDVATGKLLREMGGHRASIYGLAFSPDNSILALGTLGPSVQLWDVNTGKLLRGINNHGDQFVFGVAFSPDGKIIASCSRDFIILSEVASGKELGRLQTKKPAEGLMFTPDGKTLLSWGEEGDVKIWDVQERKIRFACTGRFGDGRSLALSHDGKTMIQATYPGSTLCVWDVATGKERFTDFEGHDTAVNCIAFSPDGKTLVSVGDKQQLRKWDVKSWKPIGEWKESARSLSFSPDGTKLALVPAYERVVRIKDVASGKTDRQIPVDDVDYVWRVCFARGGKLLVSVDSNRSLGGTPKGTARLVVWDPGPGLQLRKLLIPDVIPESLAVSRDGRWAFVGDTGGVLHGCNLETSRIANVVPGAHKQAIVALALSSDDRLLLSGSYDRQVRLWERITGKEIFTFQGHQRALAAVAFSPNGRLAASAGGNPAHPYPASDPRKIRLWDTMTGKELMQFQGHDTDVTSLDFSPDGSLLASGLRNATVLVWAVPPGIANAPAPNQAVKDEDLTRLWRELAGDNASQARSALWTLVACRDQAVSILRARLKPAPSVEAKQIQRWISDLGSEEFATREKAVQELNELGELAESAVKKALDDPPTLEARRRLNQVLDRIHRGIPSGTMIQSLRAVEVLERIGTNESKSLLKSLAGGASESRLALEAKAALERLEKRPAK
jgi:WD40 repeat protein